MTARITRQEAIRAYNGGMADRPKALIMTAPGINCDEELCDGAVGIFESFLSFLPAATVIKTFPTLLSSLLMIFPGGPEVCQQSALTFLNGVRERGGEYASEISNLAQSFPPELTAVPELAALA